MQVVNPKSILNDDIKRIAVPAGEYTYNPYDYEFTTFNFTVQATRHASLRDILGYFNTF